MESERETEIRGAAAEEEVEKLSFWYSEGAFAEKRLSKEQEKRHGGKEKKRDDKKKE